MAEGIPLKTLLAFACLTVACLGEAPADDGVRPQQSVRIREFRKDKMRTVNVAPPAGALGLKSHSPGRKTVAKPFAQRAPISLPQRAPGGIVLPNPTRPPLNDVDRGKSSPALSASAGNHVRYAESIGGRSIKIMEYGKQVEPRRASETSGLTTARTSGLSSTKRPQSTETTSGSDSSELSRTVDRLPRSLRKMKRSLANPAADAPRKLPLGAGKTRLPPTRETLQRVIIEEEAHFPGDSARRLGRTTDGRLKRLRLRDRTTMRSALLRTVQPASIDETQDGSTGPRASVSPPPARANDQRPPRPFPEPDSRIRTAQQPLPAERPTTIPQENAPRNPPAYPPVNPAEGDPAEPLEELKDTTRALADLSTDIQLREGELPPDYAAIRFAKAGEVRHGVGTSREWGNSAFNWEPSGVCHRPLYFEDINLERHGYTYGALQPVASAAHFFGRVPALPYLSMAQPHRECFYTLGHYRPGSYAPFERYWPPLSVKGGLFEAGVVSGLIFLIP